MFHVFWPASAILTMCVVGVILVILKRGPRFCKTRHDTLPTDDDWDSKTYTHELSVSTA